MDGPLVGGRQIQLCESTTRTIAIATDAVEQAVAARDTSWAMDEL